jgi:alkylhydroperoxidase family enzyme
VAFGAEETRAVMADHRAAAITPGLRATLDYLEKCTLHPDEVTPADAEAVLAAGVTRDALIEALQVMFLFNIYDRLADTLGWEIQRPEHFRRGAQALLRRGYR